MCIYILYVFMRTYIMWSKDTKNPWTHVLMSLQTM